jgi:hypothetical protein
MYRRSEAFSLLRSRWGDGSELRDGYGGRVELIAQPPEPMERIEMNDIGHGADRDGWLSPPES